MSLYEASSHVLIAGSGGMAAQPGTGFAFDVFASPTGDDTTGNGTIGNPWSLGIINTNPTAVQSKKLGLLPGTYQQIKNNGVVTTLYALAQAGQQGSNNGLFVMPLGTSLSAQTLIGSSDATGHYSPRTATIDFTKPTGSVTFTGSMAPNSNGCGLLTVTNVVGGAGQILPAAMYFNAPGTPAGVYWIDAQITSTESGGALGGMGTYNISCYGDTVASATYTAQVYPTVPAAAFATTGLIPVTLGASIPTQGYTAFAGLRVMHSSYAAYWFINATGCSIYDNEILNSRTSRRETNPGCFHYEWCDGNFNVYNNKIHDISTQPPATLVIATSICNGSTVSGAPTPDTMCTGGTFAQPWPWDPGVPSNPVLFGYSTYAQGDTISSGRAGLITSTGSTSFSFSTHCSIANPSGGSYATLPAGTFTGGNFSNFDGVTGATTGLFPYATGSLYPLQCVDSKGNTQTFNVTCTKSSTAFSVTGGSVNITLSQTNTPWTFYIQGLQMSSSQATTVMTILISSFAPFGLRCWMQIPGGDFVGGLLHYNNTAYSVGGFELAKDYDTNCPNISYCYIEMGRAGITQGVTLNGLTAANASGFQPTGTGYQQTCNFHHNVIWGSLRFINSNDAGADDNDGTYGVYNNTVLNGAMSPTIYNGQKTFYTLVINPTVGLFNINSNICWWVPPQTVPTNLGQFCWNWHNSRNWGLMVSSSINYNFYPATMRFNFGISPADTIGSSWVPPVTFMTSNGITLANWQTANYVNAPPGFPGFDANSVGLSGSPFVGTSGDGNPVSIANNGGVFVTATYQLSATLGGGGTNPCLTGSATGGAAGAFDGTVGPTGNVMGCNF